MAPHPFQGWSVAGGRVIREDEGLPPSRTKQYSHRDRDAVIVIAKYPAGERLAG